MKNEGDAAIRLVRFLKELGVNEHRRIEVPKIEEEWKDFFIFAILYDFFYFGL
jgi:hypothetical protein